MADTKTPLEENRYYHIYNHAVGKELLFFKEENYLYFLNKLAAKLSLYFNFYAYCLMPNHFHLVVSVKDFHTPVVISNPFATIPLQGFKTLAGVKNISDKE